MRLTKYNVILGSNSPRRKKILEEIGISFTSKSCKKEERYPEHLLEKNISEYLAVKKAKCLEKDIGNNDLLITADTIVITNTTILNKPETKIQAKRMLEKISGTSHKVVTSVCLKSKNKQKIFSEETIVFFNKIDENIINYYIDTYHPFDKAGSYGIQDWIGLIAIKRIEGSYTNVVGLPASRLFNEIRKF